MVPVNNDNKFQRGTKAVAAITTFLVFTAVLSSTSVSSSSLRATTERRSVDTEHHSTRDLRYDPHEVGEVPEEVQKQIDPQLIDFVVAGFQKCGTTYLQNKILHPSERIYIPHEETHYLQNDKYTEFVAQFENVTKSTTNNNDESKDKNDDDENHHERKNDEKKEKVVGYKAPFELGHEKSLRNLESLFPDVRMVITMRHPVLQFESLYNYKLRTLPDLIPTVENFIGVCGELCPAGERRKLQLPQHSTDFDNEDDFKSYLLSTLRKNNKGNEKEEEESLFTSTKVIEVTDKKVKKKKDDDSADNNKAKQCVQENLTFCTGESNYHQYLSRLGFTPMDTKEELELLDNHDMPIHDFKKTKLFLLEVGQLDNRVNQSMADDAIADLETFLQLDEFDLPRIPHRQGDKRPKKTYEYPEDREGQVIDICLDKYEPLREILMETSRNASDWIIKYLLDPSNRRRVIVSNIDIFVDMMEQWKIDPCTLDREDDSD